MVSEFNWYLQSIMTFRHVSLLIFFPHISLCSENKDYLEFLPIYRM